MSVYRLVLVITSANWSLVRSSLLKHTGFILVCQTCSEKNLSFAFVYKLLKLVLCYCHLQIQVLREYFQRRILRTN
ncbi:hypothetical protein Zm00014a_004940 [Zea mays]|uniref:Uncharacterized protein n=1 Tax=Zea mays TaxID=4577 RepID=A0A317Y9G2_MAIZE|nr:hypothetical protein Zm00014a_004940 [Zea mays]